MFSKLASLGLRLPHIAIAAGTIKQKKHKHTLNTQNYSASKNTDINERAKSVAGHKFCGTAQR